MQIPSVPPPIVTSALPQDVAAKAVPNVQAIAPLVQNAVAPPPKSEKFNQSKNNKERGKDKSGEQSKEEGDDKDKRGGSVNIRV